MCVLNLYQSYFSVSFKLLLIRVAVFKNILIAFNDDCYSQQPLNYERKKTYTLHIEGMNTHADPRFSYLGSFKDTATLKITVGDVDEGPVFSIDHYIMDVYENAPSGTEVGTVTARDPDSRNSPVR